MERGAPKGGVAAGRRARLASNPKAPAATGLGAAAGPTMEVIRTASGAIAAEAARVSSVLRAVRRGVAPASASSVLPRTASSVVVMAIEGRLAAPARRAPAAAPAPASVTAPGALATTAAVAASSGAHGEGRPGPAGTGADCVYRAGWSGSACSGLACSGSPAGSPCSRRYRIRGPFQATAFPASGALCWASTNGFRWQRCSSCGWR